MLQYRHVVVFAPAPIAVGDEIEVELVNLSGTTRVDGVRVRDVATSIVYGGGGLFDAKAQYDIVGHRADYLSPRLFKSATVLETFRGRVRECVVSNVRQDEGHAPCTSFLVEIADPSPYR